MKHKEKTVRLFGGPVDGRLVRLPFYITTFAYPLGRGKKYQELVYNQDANNPEHFNYAPISNRH